MTGYGIRITPLSQEIHADVLVDNTTATRKSDLAEYAQPAEIGSGVFEMVMRVSRFVLSRR